MNLPRRGNVFFLATLLLITTPLVKTRGALPPTSEEIKAVIQLIKAEATTEVIANQGISKFNLLKQKILQQYPPDKYPLPTNPYSGPGFGYNSEEKGCVSHAKINDQAGAYFIVGAEAVFRGIPDVAKWCFANAASLAYMCPFHLSNLAFILNLERDYKNAVILLEFAKSLDPEYSSIYVNLGYSYQNLENYDAAIQAYIAATVLNPDIPDYQKSLIAVMKKKKAAQEKTAVSPTKSKRAETTQSQKLGQALNLLKKSKQQNFQETPSIPFNAPRPKGGGPRIKAPGNSGSTVPDNELPQWIVSQMEFLINHFEQGARETKLEVAKLPYGSNRHVIGELGVSTGLMMAFLCRGILWEATGEWYESGDEGWFAEQAIKDLEKWEKTEEYKEENFSKFHLGPIGISGGNKGTWKLDVSAGIIGGEWKFNTKTYNFGVKGSLGPQLKLGLGPVNAAIGGEAYFEVDLEKGPVVGIEAKNTISIGGAQLGEGKITLTKLSFENIHTPHRSPVKIYKPNSLLP